MHFVLFHNFGEVFPRWEQRLKLQDERKDDWGYFYGDEESHGYQEFVEMKSKADLLRGQFRVLFQDHLGHRLLEEGMGLLMNGRVVVVLGICRRMFVEGLLEFLRPEHVVLSVESRLSFYSCCLKL